MEKYAIGDAVIQDKRISVVIRAIFTTLDGKLKYAVENDGALDFVEDDRLARDANSSLAA